jgi:hypothetical protein
MHRWSKWWGTRCSVQTRVPPGHQIKKQCRSLARENWLFVYIILDSNRLYTIRGPPRISICSVRNRCYMYNIPKSYISSRVHHVYCLLCIDILLFSRYYIVGGSICTYSPHSAQIPRTRLLLHSIWQWQMQSSQQLTFDSAAGSIREIYML